MPVYRKATEEEVRELHESEGLDVRIDENGHVEFKRPQSDNWYEGRYVSEYIWTAEQGVYLV